MRTWCEFLKQLVNAESLEIRRSTAETWIKLDEDKPRPKGGNYRGLLTEDDKDRLLALLEDDSQLTLQQLKSKLGLQCSTSTICRALNGMAFTLKKFIMNRKEWTFLTIDENGKYMFKNYNC